MAVRTRASVVAGVLIAACAADRSLPFRTTESDAGAAPTDRGAGVAEAAVDGGTCREDRDCDDRVDCTEDTCVIGGVCEHTALASRCAAGERCFPRQGCATMETRRCATDPECDDGVPCTRDICVAGGACSSVRDDARCGAGLVCGATGCVAMGRCAGDGECQNGLWCDGDERCVGGACQPGAARACADGDPCTGDVCSEAMDRCEHPALNPCGGTVQSGTYALTPAPTHTCAGSTVGSISQIMITASGSGVEVTGAPITLRGPASTDGSFAVEGEEIRAGYRWQYVFTGSFTMAGRFNGVWNASVSGGVLANTCSMRSVTLVGVRQ